MAMANINLGSERGTLLEDNTSWLPFDIQLVLPRFMLMDIIHLPPRKEHGFMKLVQPVCRNTTPEELTMIHVGATIQGESHM